MIISTFRKILAGATCFLALVMPAAAQVDAAFSRTGSTDALNFSVTIATEQRFIGTGKLYFVLFHNNQFYLLSETRGFVPYTGGEIPEYKTIGRSTEAITINNWSTRSQLGGEIFVGYGADFFEMLNSGRFKHIATLTEITAPANPYAALSRSYSCYNTAGIFIETLRFNFTPTKAEMFSGQQLLITLGNPIVMADGPSYDARVSNGRELTLFTHTPPIVGTRITYSVSYHFTYSNSTSLDFASLRLCK